MKEVNTNGQCSGLMEAAYPGSGTNQLCDWAHPLWALDGNGNWKIQVGDSLMIYLGNYRLLLQGQSLQRWRRFFLFQ
jgi:hypothetical protein